MTNLSLMNPITDLFAHKVSNLIIEAPLLSKHDSSLPDIDVELIESPLIGTQRVIDITVNSIVVPALLDTGAASSFITYDLATKLHLSISAATSPIKVKGAFSANSNTASSITELTFAAMGLSQPITISLYVVDNIGKNNLIIGDPVLQLYPDLLTPVCVIDTIDTSSYFDDVEMTYIIDTYQGADFTELNPVSLADADAADDPHKDTVSRILSEYSDCVADTLPDTTSTSSYRHSIELIPDAPLPKSNPFNLSLTEEQEVAAQVKNLLDLGHIVPSASPLSSPVLLVKKNDGSFRMVIDYRKLNKATVDDPFPIPRISSLLAKVGSANIFSKLDLLSGYHQVKMNPDDAFKTAFVTNNGKYHFKVMPFGLKNSPATFCRMMADIFRSCPFVLVYLDDILIFSNSPQEHLEHVKFVLDTLKTNFLVAKKSKCEFFQSVVDFLGCTISADSITPSAFKVAAVKNFAVPKTPKEVKSFLGLINYVRKFIPDCSKLQSPLIEFETGKVTAMGPAQLQSFRQLQDAITSGPVLTTFKPDIPLRLTTDASIKGVGGYLEHIDDDGKTLGIIGYYSAALSTHEKNYPVRELELLGVVRSLEHFRYYLLGRRFVLRTDHQSLLSLKNLEKPPSGRLIRHLDKLAEFGYDIQYLKGSENVVADPLSRLTDFTVEIPPVYDLSAINPHRGQTNRASHALFFDSSTWSKHYADDPFCAAYLKSTNEDFSPSSTVLTNSSYKKYLKRLTRSPIARSEFSMINGLIHHKGRIVVPHQEIPTLFDSFHTHDIFGGHYATSKTLKKMENYHFPNKSTIVPKMISQCPDCQLTKDTSKIARYGLVKPLDVAKGRWTDISMDFITGLPLTPSGHNAILVICCRFTKRVILIPAKTTWTSFDTWNAIYHFVILSHGLIKTIVSDRDVRVTSKWFREMCDSFRIKQLMSTTNHPQTDGQSERTIKTVVESLRASHFGNHDQWDAHLKEVEFAYNNTYHSTIKMTPAFADLGYELGTPDVYLSNALNSRSDNAREHARKLKSIKLQIKDAIEDTRVAMQSSNKAASKLEVKLKVGDLVLIHKDAYYSSTVAAKLGSLFIGPFKIVEVISDNAYVVDTPIHLTKLHRTFNVDCLKLFQYSDKYLKPPPRSPGEADSRIKEILSVVGISWKHQQVLTKFREVDPSASIPISFEAFFSLGRGRCVSLLRNLKNVIVHDANPDAAKSIDSLIDTIPL